MKKIVIVLFVSISAAGCGLLEEEQCSIVSGELMEDGLEVQDVLFREAITFTLSYSPADCFMPTSIWSLPDQGEVEGVFEFQGEATLTSFFDSGGDVCVRLQAEGDATNTVCKSFAVIREDVWGASFIHTYPGLTTNRNITLALKSGVYSGFGEQNEWYFLDTDSWIWTEKANLPFANFEAFTGFAINETGYILGQSGFLYRYNEEADSWTEVAEFPEDMTITFEFERWSNVNNATSFIYPFIGTSVDGKGYFGVAGSGRFFEYDPATNQFTELASYPEPGIENANYFTWQDRIYLGKHRYNPSANLWEGAPDRYSFDNFDRLYAVLDDGVYFQSSNTTFRFTGTETIAYQPRPVSNRELRPASGITQGAIFNGITYFPQAFQSNIFVYFIKN